MSKERRGHGRSTMSSNKVKENQTDSEPYRFQDQISFFSLLARKKKLKRTNRVIDQVR